MNSRVPTPTVFWGTACISERENKSGQTSFVYKESEALKPLSVPENKGQPKKDEATTGYIYQMSTVAGEGIVIYIIENTLRLGYSPHQLTEAALQTEIKKLVDDNKIYYSSEWLKEYLLKENGDLVLKPLAGAEIDARVVLVNKPSSGPDAGGGIGLAYRAILEHYHTLKNTTRAILNVSAGSTASTIQYSIDSLSRLDDLIKDGIWVISAAGNRADNHLTEMTKERVDTFWEAVQAFPGNQYEHVRSVIKSLLAIIPILSALADQADQTRQSKIKDLISGAAMSKSDLQVKTLNQKVKEADNNTKADPRIKISETEIQRFKDSLRGIFDMTNTVLPLISDIKEMAKTSLASKLGATDTSLNDLQTNITAITTAMDSMKILYGPEAPKIPAAHRKVLSVGGLSTKYTICKEFYYGDAIDIYAPAQSIPFMDQFKSIHDTYEKEKKKGPEDEGPPKKETVRLNGTSYASPIAAGAIACLLSQTVKDSTDTSQVNHSGIDTDAWKNSVKDIARTHTEKNDKTPPQDESFKILCIAPGV